MTTVHEPLVSAILKHDVEWALYETGDLLNKGYTTELEHSWIHVLAVVGEALDSRHTSEYQRCLMCTHDIVCADEGDILVKDAFLLTTRLCIMSQRYPTLYAKPALTRLRTQVIDMFPENASLNASGQEMFKSVLPPESSEEYSFVQRVLAGLSKIWTNKADGASESRIAIEYLSRKKLSIPKPKWILPHIRDDPDIVWMLWAAILLYFDSDVTRASFEVFTKWYKKHIKHDRIGILWAMAYVAPCSYNDDVETWTEEASKLYQKVEENIENLWGQIVATNSEKESQVTESSQEIEPFFWVTFFPRNKNTRHQLLEDANDTYIKEEARLLKIRNSRR